MTTQKIKSKAALVCVVGQSLCSDEYCMQKAGAQRIAAVCRL